MTIITIQFLGLLIASFFHLGLVSLANRLSRGYWWPLYIALTIALGSVLSLQSMIAMKWLPIGLSVLIFSFGIVGLRDVLRFLRSIEGIRLRHTLSQKNWKIRIFVGFVLIVLGAEILYAAYPAYRYDQWFYHLSIPRMIARFGTLQTPIYHDHTYFAGVFEYLFTCISIWFDKPILLQSAVNAFTYEMFLIFCIGFACQVRKLSAAALRDYFITDLVLAASLVVFFVFSLPEHEAIYSAKPDAMLYMCGVLMLFYSSIKLKLVPAKPNLFDMLVLGFFAVAPLALKITYLHFQIVLAPVILCILWQARHERREFRLFALGFFLGAIVAMPMLVKNWYFFANPMHPAQFAFFKSSPWDQLWTDYWQNVHQKPVSFEGLLKQVPEVLLSVLFRLKYHLLFLAAGAIYIAKYQVSTRWRPIVFCLLATFLYAVIWPAFYGSAAFDRFVYPLFSGASVAVLLMASQIPSLRFLVLLLIVPGLVNSGVDAKINRMIPHIFADEVSYFANHRAPYSEVELDRIINEHRRSRFPRAGLYEHIVISNTPNNFFLDSERLDILSMDFQFMLKNYPTGCYWTVLRDYDVSYVRLNNNHPPEIEKKFPLNKAKTAGITLDPWRKLFFLDPELVGRQAAEEIGCQRLIPAK